VRCWFYRTTVDALGSANEVGAVEALFYQQDGKCVYTGVPLIPGVNASIDHKTPTARGGTKTLDNLQWITNDINHTKGAMCHEDFVAMCIGVAMRFPHLASVGIQSLEAARLWPT
jgi:5-methylcytosine-specific restriction endonuclease McrA